MKKKRSHYGLLSPETETILIKMIYGNDAVRKKLVKKFTTALDNDITMARTEVFSEIDVDALDDSAAASILRAMHAETIEDSRKRVSKGLVWTFSRGYANQIVGNMDTADWPNKTINQTIKQREQEIRKSLEEIFALCGF